MASRTVRPGRTLLIFLLAIVVMYGLAAIGGTWKPKLGLDLAGGTTITLVPEGNPAGGQLDQAANIIRQRVNGNGVTEATVEKQGSQIVVSIPGKLSQGLVDSVSRQAQLRFRVLADCGSNPCEANGLPVKPAPKTPSKSPSATPTSSPTATPTKKATPTSKPSASPLGRPAVDFGTHVAKATSTPSPTPTLPLTVTPTGSATPIDQNATASTAATLA